MTRTRGVFFVGVAGSVVVACAGASKGPTKYEAADYIVPPCTFESIGHRKAHAITPRAVQPDGLENQPPTACGGATTLVQNEAEYRAYLATLRSSAPVAPPTTFAAETLVVADNDPRYTYAIEGDALVVIAHHVCMGTQLPCTPTLLAVPKVNAIVRATCPDPKARCMAP